MTTIKLKAHAEKEIKRLKLGDSPTNCHGVVAYDDAGDGAIRLSDGTGLNEVCRTIKEIDGHLGAMADWYAESK